MVDSMRIGLSGERVILLDGRTSRSPKSHSRTKKQTTKIEDVGECNSSPDSNANRFSIKGGYEEWINQ